MLLEIWRHAIEHFPLAYDARYWGLVFPLGMYATTTDSLAHTFELPFLEPVAGFFGVVALVTWIVTTIAWLWRVRARLSGQYVGTSPAGIAGQ